MCVCVLLFQRTIALSGGIKLSRQGKVAGDVRGRFASRIGEYYYICVQRLIDRGNWRALIPRHPNFRSQGEDSVEYFLGLTPSGIILLRNKTKVGNYYWPRINKIYYKVTISRRHVVINFQASFLV